MTSVTLQSEDHRRLLDIIDRLRSKGIAKYVDLPQIVVCGDQSAGKSSVLEAISGMTFPTKDNLCTRFATELILRRETKTSVNISIIPGPDRSEDEKEKLANVSFEFDVASPDLSSVVEKAKDSMGLSESKAFSSDTLRVELCGLNQPHLTMVDLPGLFRAGNRDQSVEDAATVKNMVVGHMKRPRSIVLAVVSAKSDFALQDVTELSRELDPMGTRTLGLITKPDTLDVGSDSESAYVKLAQNGDVVFRLGWHVLKNRSFESKSASSSQRDEDERRFFASGIWASMDRSCVGARSLKQRLSTVLKDQILLQLPELCQDVQAGIESTRTQMSRLGDPRTTFLEQHRYLLGVAHRFSVLMKSLVDGVYTDPFFGSLKSSKDRQKRLRATVQNDLTEFAETISTEGEARVIIDEGWEQSNSDSRDISRVDYVKSVKNLMRQNRGCELPGTFNPSIIGELFKDQCQPWKNLAFRAKEQIVRNVHCAINAVVEHTAVAETTDGILGLINQDLNALKLDLDEKVTHLFESCTKLHPITYNHYLTENVQKAQSDRRRRLFEKSLRELFGSASVNENAAHVVRPSKLLRLQERRTEADMESFASELAVDYMEAYYKVALKRFVDDFSVLAIEHCLIAKLPSLFTSDRLQHLTEKEISSLATESEDAVIQRSHCTEKLAVLEAGLCELQALDKHRAVSHDYDLDDNQGLYSDTESGDVVVAPSQQSNEAALSRPIVPDGPRTGSIDEDSTLEREEEERERVSASPEAPPMPATEEDQPWTEGYQPATEEYQPATEEVQPATEEVQLDKVETGWGRPSRNKYGKKSKKAGRSWGYPSDAPP